jgi:hypothetical protein
MNTAENNQNTENKKTGAPIGMVILTGVILVGFVGLLVWGLGNAAQGTLKIGEKVPDFTLTTFDGGTIQTADLRGKVVLINIWASWCDPCANEAGYLEQAWRYYQDSGKRWSIWRGSISPIQTDPTWKTGSTGFFAIRVCRKHSSLIPRAS